MLFVMSSSPSSQPLEPVSLVHVVETPENVVLQYKLAGPALRLGAFVVDLIIRVVIVLVFLFFAGLTFGRDLPSLTLAMTLVLVFFLDWVYFVVCEGFFKGRTIGKRMFGLRVIHVAGYPISLWEATIRNFVRAMDSAPFFLWIFGIYGIAWLSMLVCGKFRRLGDIVAQTIVIEERRVKVPREPIILEKISPLSMNEIGGWTPPASTMSVIEEFLSRRGVLSYQRGHGMAIGLARAIATKLDFRGPKESVEEYPMAFLAKVYATFHRVDDEVIEAVEAEIEEVQERPRSRKSSPVRAG